MARGDAIWLMSAMWHSDQGVIETEDAPAGRSDTLPARQVDSVPDPSAVKLFKGPDHD
jgi:hypothetical protein